MTASGRSRHSRHPGVSGSPQRPEFNGSPQPPAPQEEDGAGGIGGKEALAGMEPAGEVGVVRARNRTPPTGPALRVRRSAKTPELRPQLPHEAVRGNQCGPGDGTLGAGAADSDTASTL